MEQQIVEALASLQKSQSLMLDRLERNERASLKGRTKTPASSGNAVELHGVGSLFGSHSIERDVLTAYIRPLSCASHIPNFPTVYEQPFFAAITGFTADVGSEPTAPCDDAPVTYMKACDLTAQFGRLQRDTKTIEINDVILKKNRGDFSDLILHGSLLSDTGFLPGGMTDDEVLNLTTKAEMIAAGVSLERKLGQQFWRGSPFNNVGAYKEFPGLANQIATGQKDAHSGTLCPALDSDVKLFGWQNVESRNSLRDIVDYLSAMEFYLYNNAERMGLLPATWLIALRPELWFVLSGMWPCAYNTNRCGVAPEFSGSTVTQPTVDAVAMRSLVDDMRQGMYIDINGRRYPVCADDGILEHTNATNANVPAGCYASSIYFVPLTAGGLTLTYMEHVDYRAAGADIALLRGTENFWSDDGRYFWAIEHLKWCYKLSVKTEQRVVLRAPQLAGRIDQVLYCPQQHLRSSDPASPYFLDGGVSMRPDETTFHVW